MIEKTVITILFVFDAYIFSETTVNRVVLRYLIGLEPLNQAPLQKLKANPSWGQLLLPVLFPREGSPMYPVLCSFREVIRRKTVSRKFNKNIVWGSSIRGEKTMSRKEEQFIKEIHRLLLLEDFQALRRIPCWWSNVDCKGKLYPGIYCTIWFEGIQALGRRPHWEKSKTVLRNMTQIIYFKKLQALENKCVKVMAWKMVSLNFINMSYFWRI